MDIRPPRFIEKIKEIDRGSSGTVWLCRDTRIEEPDKRDIAVKFIPRGPLHIDECVKREVFIVRKLYHRHITLFREALLSPSHLCLVFNYVRGGNLGEYVVGMGGFLPEYLARFFFQQLVLAVDFCHRIPPNGIINRDLKLQNVLVENPNESFPKLLLCDFGFGKERGEDPTVSKLGTLFYAAPEIFFRSTRGERYDGKMADIYSLGVCLHRMLFGTYPRQCKRSEGSSTQWLQHMELELQGDPQLLRRSPHLVCLLTGLLQPNPDKRMTMDGIWEDPWFSIDLPINADGSHIRNYNTMMLAYQKQALNSDYGQSENELTELVQKAKTC